MFPLKRTFGFRKKRFSVIVCALIFTSATSSAQNALLDDFRARAFTNCGQSNVDYFGPLVQPVALCILGQMSPAHDCKAVYEIQDLKLTLESTQTVAAEVGESIHVLAQYSKARQRLIVDGVPHGWKDYLVKRDSEPYDFGELRGTSWHIGNDLQPLGVLAGIAPGAEVTVDEIEASKVVCDGHGDVTLPVVKPPSPEELEAMYKEARRFLDIGDFAHAKPLLDKACLYGFANSCAELGVVYMKGKLVGQDYYKARILSERACKGGNMSGCNNLGFLLANGYGGAEDLPRARGLLEKVCAGGGMGACINLGVLYAHGKLGKKDKDQARMYFTKACNAGNVDGCADLKAMK